jgi:hypothetical protein
MTMIACTTRPDGADIITDTLTYRSNGRTMGQTTKLFPMPHIDTVVMTQGGGEFGARWKYAMACIGDQLDALSFDDLAEAAPQALPDIWKDTEGASGYEGTVFHVGFSPAAGRFKAYIYSSHRDFESYDVTDELCATPLPISDPPDARPESEVEWADLAVQIRRERALAPLGLKVFVGGDVFLTRLERGSISQRKIHTFDDSGEEFRLMVAGTAHPVAQLGPCECGSGEVAEACHPYMPPEEPCTCRSGAPWQGCCRVTDEQIGTARAARQWLASVGVSR